MDLDKVAEFIVLPLFIVFLIHGSSALTCVPSTVNDQDLHWSDSPTGQHSYTPKTLQVESCHEKKERMYSTLQDGTIPIDCGRCQVFDVDLEMWDTRPETNCWSLTPELIVGRLNCVWQNSCGLQYTKSSHFWPPKDPVDCPYIKMGYSCLLPETPIDEIIGTPEVAAVSGLVRSRDTPAADSLDQINPSTHLLRVTPPTTDIYPEYVLVTEIRSKLGKGDELNLTDASQQCHVRLGLGDVTTVHNFSTTALVFKMVSGDWSRASAGVDICFQWFTKADVNPDFKFQKTLRMCKQMKLKSPNLPVFPLIKFRVSRHRSGMVRSHWKFPWNYPRPHSGPFRPGQPSWTSLYHRLESPDQGLTTLRVQVISLELYSWDLLTFHPQEGATTSSTSMKEGGLYDFETSRLTLNFTILNSRHHSRRGFLLCYEWFSSTQVLRQRPCDAFVRSVDVCRKKRRLFLPKECRRKKSKRNAKKRKRERKKKKKEKRVKNALKESACRKKKKTELQARKPCPRHMKRKKKLGKGKRKKRKHKGKRRKAPPKPELR